MDETRCKETVYPNETWGSFHGHQCRHKTWQDGYCRVHHPDTIKARQAESQKRHEAKRETNPRVRLFRATERIAALEAELARVPELCRMAYVKGASAATPLEVRDCIGNLRVWVAFETEAERLYPTLPKTEEEIA